MAKELDRKTVRVDQRYESHTYIAGHDPTQGDAVHGWTGQETLVRRTIVKPIVTFMVNEADDEFEFQYNPSRNIVWKGRDKK